MTGDITLVLIIMVASFMLLIQERLRVDLIALMVLVSLALAGLITPTQALSGFSNPAVITVWAVFILSGGLARSGIANRIGNMLIKVSGNSEARVVLAIMLTAGVLSGFLNNVGVTALLLPVVMDISRRIQTSPARLLMPLAYGALLGGMLTLIGTPPNILVNNILVEQGYAPFQFFSFSPMGALALGLGTAFMSTIGRRLLPRHDRVAVLEQRKERQNELYDIDERLFIVEIPDGSPLAGRPLNESRIGAALELNVVAILRGKERLLAPPPETELRSGDNLIVEGRIDRLAGIRNSHFLILEGSIKSNELTQDRVQFREVELAEGSPLVGTTLFESGFRTTYGMTVIAIEHDGHAQRTNLQGKVLSPGDRLLLLGGTDELIKFEDSPDWQNVITISQEEVNRRYQLDERVLVMRVPQGSLLVGQTIKDNRLADAFGIEVLGLRRSGTTDLLPDPDTVLSAGDLMLVEAEQDDISILQGLQGIDIMLGPLPELRSLQSDEVGLVEVVLSPFSTMVGKTLRELHFREKFGLSVLAIWRSERAFRSRLRDMQLRFGDALLLYGPRSRHQLLRSEQDLLVLTQSTQESTRSEKAPIAILIMAGVILPVVLHWLPIELSAVIGATLMVLFGVLNMDEAYRAIDWKSVFLIAGMLPLGIAMQQTGAAAFLAGVVVDLVGGAGIYAVMAGLFILTALTSQVMPGAALAVIMAPIAIGTAVELGVSPYTLTMLMAVAVSANFLSPVAHPANSLVMGPGGYRFRDFIKAGAPITLLLLIASLVFIPLLFPF